MSSKKGKSEELRATPSVDEPEDKGHKKKDGEAGEGGEGAEGEGGKGPNAKKIVLFVVVPLFLLLGIGAGLYFSGMLDHFLKKDAAVAEKGGHGEESGHGKKAEVKVDEHGNAVLEGAYFLQMPDMLVNLSNADGGSSRYLRLQVQLELGSEADKKTVEAVMPRVVDQFQTYLRELRVKDLRGSAGIYRLQMELLNRVNAAASPVEVKDVLFQEILIQ